MSYVDDYLLRKLNERSQAGNLRRLSTARAPVDFYSNDYLGLATTGALARMHLQYGEMTTGATGSRLLSGNNAMAEQLEATIAAFHGADSALLFNSGYDANVGLLSSIGGKDSIFLYDELCHASIIDGVRLSLSQKRYKFRHSDLDDLSAKLSRHGDSGNVIVIVESVYSMDGDMAPLQELARLCHQYNAKLIVDEAHATGVTGAHGEGAVCAAGLEKDIFARVHTFGKALGCHGAAVLGSNVLKQFLVNFARSFIYTTALPPHSIAAIGGAYEYLSSPGFNNKPLTDIITYFRQKIYSSKFSNWKDSHSAIQALVIGDNKSCKQLAGTLQQAGLQVNAILHPTVPDGSERLRICLHSFNTLEQIDLLFELLNQSRLD